MDQHEQFPFLKDLEAGWKDALEELDNLLYAEVEANVSYFHPWKETIYTGNWDVYSLYWQGKKDKKNCERCPKTTALVEAVPGMVSAGFSALAPNTHIEPHVGYTDEVLRCHLGLIVPKPLLDCDRRSSPPMDAGTCWLRVGEDIYNWTPGKAFVFDDTIEHEALNCGDRTRFILLIDFKKPFETMFLAK